MTVEEAIALVSETIRNKKCDCLDCQAAKILMNEIWNLNERLRVAEAVRDDARRASQRYLDEKREFQAEVIRMRGSQ